jgi:hypothetical protein
MSAKKGLEWALRLRADLQMRIEQLREALAGIEPLRQELARLEEQLKGVERLVAVYHDQLGYPKLERPVQPVATEVGPMHAEDAISLEAAFFPYIENLQPPTPPPPTLMSILRGQALGAIALCRQGAAHARETALRFWLSARGFSLSVRSWLADLLPRRNTQS